MNDFISQYRAAFEAVGRPLTAADAISEEELEAAQQWLGHKLPKALLDFYRVAGKTDYFRNSWKLSPLNELLIEEGRLIFFGDVYYTFWFGLDLPIISEDPSVIFSEGYSACGLCSLFLSCCLYQEATEGGMPFTAESIVMNSTMEQLKSQWESPIELDHWHIYKHKERVVFLWSRNESCTEWGLNLGVMKHSDIEATAHELNIELKEVEH